MNRALNKVALLTDGIWPYVIGGMQKHSFFLCKYLAKQGVEVHLYHLKGLGDQEANNLEYFTAEEKKYIKSTIVPFPGYKGFPGHYLLNSYFYSRNIFENIKEQINSFDFIYAQGLTAWYFFDKKIKRPLIGINIHGYEFLQHQANFKSKIDSFLLSHPFKYINRKADVVFSLGGKLTNMIKELGVESSRIIEIPGGIEAEWVNSSLRKTEGKKKFIFVGRYERRKGIEELHQIIPELLKDSHFEFHFVGPIPDSLKIVHPSVKYFGTVTGMEQMQQLLQNADILVCPSYAEGLPTVILEAMACGCAIIATNVGAVSEAVDSENGWLIPPADKKALLNCLESAINMESEIIDGKRKQSIKKIKDEFLWDKIIAETISKIEEKIEG
jgi:glycosyltransferase involved in cell wall biosynthesis